VRALPAPQAVAARPVVASVAYQMAVSLAENLGMPVYTFFSVSLGYHQFPPIVATASLAPQVATPQAATTGVAVALHSGT